ncbi:unnamed protein product, partial [Pylaiella littoralis]
MFDAYYNFLGKPSNYRFVRGLGNATKDGEKIVGLGVGEEECIKFVGLVYFEKNKKLFQVPDPGKQVKGGEEPDPTKDWIEHMVKLTHFKHFANAHWQKVVPDFDVIELHVKRMRWVLSYWLSSHGSEYPNRVPGYGDLGYVQTGEGDSEVALMLMRREPRVTLMPGQGICEVRCKCALKKDGKAVCKACV